MPEGEKVQGLEAVVARKGRPGVGFTGQDGSCSLVPSQRGCLLSQTMELIGVYEVFKGRTYRSSWQGHDWT